MPQATKGIRLNGDVKVCMVAGCGRKALYRTGAKMRGAPTQRGYCSEHRHLAVRVRPASERTDQAWFDSHPPGYVNTYTPICSDG